MPIFEVAIAGSLPVPEFSDIDNVGRDIVDDRFLSFSALGVLEDEHPGEEAVGKHPFR